MLYTVLNYFWHVNAHRRLSGVDKPKDSKAAEPSVSLEEKLEQRLGAFGQNSGVNPAHKAPKHPTQTPGPLTGHAVPKENRFEHVPTQASLA